MLVLTRREGESVILETSDGQIEVTIEQNRGQAIRLGFKAPKAVNILRKEVVERKRG